MITGTHLSVPPKRELQTWGMSVRSSTRKRLGANQKTKEFSDSDQNIGSHPSRGNHLAEIYCEGRPSARGVSNSGEINVCKTTEKNVVKKFRLTRVAE